MMKNLQILTVTAAATLMTAEEGWAQRIPKRTDVPTIPKVSKEDSICFALYTIHEGTLKLTAQLYPLGKDDERTVRLEIEDDGKWKEIARAKVIEDGWTAPFRVEQWDDSKTVPYRVRHGSDASFSGTLRRNPSDKNEIVVAGFTGNSINPVHGGDISREDLVKNVQAVDADVLFFSGDQVYDHNRHLAAWLRFGRDFGAIIKDRPTITLPDDHDAGQPNLWGEEGKISTRPDGSDGGYVQPAAYVRQVERAQTSHLPDPVDPKPIGQGIGVYFTNLKWGGIDFAILEDRKFKTGPAGKIPKQGPRPDHINNPDYDPQSVDVPGLKLLGERQLDFLQTWTQDWRRTEMKVALSQTIFCGGAHVHGTAGGRLHADMDSNGWPQTGRNKAIRALCKGFAFHYAGDQHLATIFHHGVDEYRDGIWSFCVPSIANLYLRWWDPLKPGANREPGAPSYTGDQLDGFANKVTCYAAANPAKEPTGGDKLTTRAAGFGIVRLNKRERTIRMECWPRKVDVTDPAAHMYPGWPRTISQLDNYNPPSWGRLGELHFNKENPVVQLIDAGTNEILYTLRIKGTTFTPHAPKDKRFVIKAGIESADRIVVPAATVGSATPVSIEL